MSTSGETFRELIAAGIKRQRGLKVGTMDHHEKPPFVVVRYGGRSARATDLAHVMVISGQIDSKYPDQNLETMVQLAVDVICGAPNGIIVTVSPVRALALDTGPRRYEGALIVCEAA